MTSLPAVPCLEAPGIRVRPFRTSDVAGVCAAGTDPLIPLITAIPIGCTPQEARTYLELQQASTAERLGYYWAIADGEEDKLVGAVGLSFRDRQRASLGYWVLHAHRGNGYAGLALRLVTGWAFEALRTPRLELTVEPWNEASIRTAEGVGFSREGLLRSWQQVGDQRRDMFMYSLLPSDPVPSTRLG
jgi:ribosomal-protein-alanine N-acetyltransferase